MQNNLSDEGKQINQKAAEGIQGQPSVTAPKKNMQGNKYLHVFLWVYLFGNGNIHIETGA
jgi:hypothetical protein